MVTVSFLTPSIPERALTLEETIESVKQLSRPKGWLIEHLWEVDDEYTGCARTMNRLARRATGSWIVPLADDDFVLPWFLSDHTAVCRDADVVYAPPMVFGEDPGQFWGEPPNIPAVAMIRRKMWDQAGGYNTNLAETEDRDLYENLMGLSARFVRSDRQSWVYRLHGANKSRGYIAGLATTTN